MLDVRGVVDQQILRGTTDAPLQATLLDSDGDPTAGLTVTVDVARGDGTVLYTGATATDVGDGTYTKAVVSADTAVLDLLVATWKVAGVVRTVTFHEIVGGYYFSTVEAKTGEDNLTSLSDADVKTLRRDVEAEFERICETAFVPRYARVRVDGTGYGHVWLPHPHIRTIRSVRIYSDAVTYVAWDSTAISQLVIEGSKIRRADWIRFDVGCQNVIVEYEYGLDRPPPDVKRAAIRRCRTRKNMAAGGIPDNSLSFTADNGATYRIANPGLKTTGDTNVDAVLARYDYSPLLIG